MVFVSDFVRGLLVNLAKLAISAGLIWLSFSRIDGSRALALLQTIHPGVVIAAIVALGIQHALGGLRFHRLLGQMGASITRRAAVESSFVGLFFSQIFISFVGGDAVRFWRLIEARMPSDIAFRSVLFDRVLGFASVVVLIAISLPLVFGIVSDQKMRIGLSLAIFAGLAATVAFLLMHRLPAKLLRWRPFRVASDISIMALSISSSRAAIGYLLGISLFIHVINVGAIFLIARGLRVDANFMDFLALVPPVMLLAILPVSFAGWGVREGAMVVALGLTGIPPEQSVAISVCFGLCVLVSSVPGGITWLVTRERGVAQGLATPGTSPASTGDARVSEGKSPP